MTCHEEIARLTVAILGIFLGMLVAWIVTDLRKR